MSCKESSKKNFVKFIDMLNFSKTWQIIMINNKLKHLRLAFSFKT